jgi:hypothetical protein
MQAAAFRGRQATEKKWGVTMAQEPVIRFPVFCPVCRQETILRRALGPIAEAIFKGSPITLSAECHEGEWIASPIERQQIREYLASGVFVGRDLH